MAEPAADGLDADALLGLVDALSGSGSKWASALAAGGALIYTLHRFGLLSWLTRNKTEVQAESFQDRMLSEVAASHQRYEQMLDRLAKAIEKNDALREEVHQNRFETHMLRQQMRLFLAGLKQVKAGVLPLGDLPEPDLAASRPGGPT